MLEDTDRMYFTKRLFFDTQGYFPDFSLNATLYEAFTLRIRPMPMLVSNLQATL
jgi:hypothetical protein